MSKHGYFWLITNLQHHTITQVGVETVAEPAWPPPNRGPTWCLCHITATSARHVCSGHGINAVRPQGSTNGHVVTQAPFCAHYTRHSGACNNCFTCTCSLFQTQAARVCCTLTASACCYCQLASACCVLKCEVHQAIAPQATVTHTVSASPPHLFHELSPLTHVSTRSHSM